MNLSPSLQVEEFFRKMATKLEDAEQVHNKNQDNSGENVAAEKQVTEDKSNMELLQAEASFSDLLSNISLLYNQSIGLAKKMQPVFGHAFLETFATELQSSTLSTRGSSSGFLGSVGLEHVLHSVLDFGKSVLEGFSAPVADLFEEIKEAEEYVQQSSRGI